MFAYKTIVEQILLEIFSIVIEKFIYKKNQILHYRPNKRQWFWSYLVKDSMNALRLFSLVVPATSAASSPLFLCFGDDLACVGNESKTGAWIISYWALKMKDLSFPKQLSFILTAPKRWWEMKSSCADAAFVESFLLIWTWHSQQLLYSYTYTRLSYYLYFTT